MASFKIEDVTAFVQRVRLVLCGMRVEECKDHDVMYQWLGEKFKNYKAIERKTDKIRDSRPDSRKRTWNYLWAAITNYLAYCHEDANAINIADGLKAGKVGGAVVVPKGPIRRRSPQKVRPLPLKSPKPKPHRPQRPPNLHQPTRHLLLRRREVAKVVARAVVKARRVIQVAVLHRPTWIA